MRSIKLAALLIAGFVASAQAEQSPNADAKPADVAQPAEPATADATNAVVDSSKAEKATAADCTAVVDNLFKLEFLSDPENNGKLDELMKVAQETSEYKEVFDTCMKDFSVTEAKCVSAAKSAADVEKCDSNEETK